MLVAARKFSVFNLSWDEHVGDLDAEVGREQRPAIAPDVLAILDGAEDLRVGRRPPDPLS